MGAHISLPLVIAIGIPVSAGFIGAPASAKAVKGWYKTLKKPSWNPPDWIFAPMWTALYCAMGYASYLVWQQGGWAQQALPLGMYAAQLVANFMWTPLFFGKHDMSNALADIVAMDIGVASCIALFRPVSTTASNLMIPYLGWILFATALNYNLLKNNPDKDKKP
eukprot:jgi/Chlat1/1073/Chrsp110S08638